MRPVSPKNIFETLELLSERSGLRVETNLCDYPFIQQREKILPYAFVKKKGIIPLKEEGNLLLVAISDPYDLDTLEEVRHLTERDIKEVLAATADIDEAIEKCYQQKEDETSRVIQGISDTNKTLITIENEEEYDLLEESADSSVVKVFNMILVEALSQEASDIHFEPVESRLHVRYRIDGIMQHRHTLSKELQTSLTTRIKVLAQLDIAEHRLPQDGRIKLKMGGREIDFRVSTVPVVFGERIVMRILDKSHIILGLNEIGMKDSMCLQMRQHIKKNQGIILVTGPTGSGKTTTLYSVLSEIKSQEVNIMTIEDPVEYKLEGMAQIGVNPKIKLDFATGLRHILRQDPDVIMIGEIRDRETAEIAIQASLTGHLVLSTLHTNDAPSAIARLVDMGIEPYLLSSSLIGVLAQRLVRRICDYCKTKYHPTQSELRELGIEERENSAHSLYFYRGKGCAKCFQSGYKGRHGLYEFMSVTPRIKEQLLKSADAGKLQKIALEEKMPTLRKEGISLALSGITTIEEVIRVTRQIEEEVL